MLRTLLALALCASPLAAADWSQVPQLPHKVVPGWAQLPAGSNFGETPSVAVDKKDNVWVFNRGNRPVVQFDKSGKMLQSWANPPVVAAHGIGVGPDGAVWLVDTTGHSVMKFTEQGRLQMVIANAGRLPGDNSSEYAFNLPTSLAFRPDGGFYVADGYGNSRVVQYSQDGEYIRHWGGMGAEPGRFNTVHSITLDSKGNVYVADRTNNRIQVFDADGKFLDQWTDIGQPWGLYYVAKENAIYMCDGLDNRIIKLNLDGQILGQLSSFGKAPGKLDFAHHLAVDSEGSIYVAEIKNWRVQKFAK